MTRTRSLPPPASELLERARARFREFPLIRDWQVAIDALGPGRAELSLTATDHTVNGPGGILNGGVLATLADLACALALCTRFDGRMPFATTDLHVRYLEPARDRVEAVATVVRASPHSAVLECRMHCGGRPAALATAHFTLGERS